MFEQRVIMNILFKISLTGTEETIENQEFYNSMNRVKFIRIGRLRLGGHAMWVTPESLKYC